MQIQKIKLAQLVPNTGQIPGLPSNPRQWTKSDVDRIAKSLAETPELFEARPIIAYPFDGKFVILGGNLRYEGARKNKDTEAPVIVLPEDTPADKLKEIVIKDNGNFGAWDYDALANEWDNLALGDWGVPAWNSPGAEEELDLSGLQIEPGAPIMGSESGYSAMTFLFRVEDAELVKAWIDANSKDALVEKIVQVCQDAEAK